MSLDQPQIGVQLVYDEDVPGWRVISTGELLESTVIHTEIRSHATLTATLFDDMTTQMYAGQMDIALWQDAMFAELKDGHTANALFANGGAELSPESIARLETTIARDADLLASFAEGIDNGSISELQARARSKQYAQAMEQSYWNEWGDGLDNEAHSNLPLLSQVPGDGGTQCHGNCQCILESTEQGVFWLLFPAEHCPDCVALADGGPYRMQ